MARKFTRIEFENGAVVVVKAPKDNKKCQIKGNKAFNWDSVSDLQSLSYIEAVNKVIETVGEKVHRKLSHFSLGYS